VIFLFFVLQLVSWLVAWEASAENSDDMEEGESITHSLPAPYSSNPPPPPPSYSNPPPPPPPSSYSSPSSPPYSYSPAFAQRAGKKERKKERKKEIIYFLNKTHIKQLYHINHLACNIEYEHEGR
jgi:hypothetical protein